MKVVIAFACLFAFALANEEAAVLRNEWEVNPDSYFYILELDNNVKAEQKGNLEDKDAWFVSGEYEYVTPDGKHVKVIYTADKTGYHPEVDTDTL